MKKFAVLMVVTALLLAGCAVQTPAPVDTPPAETLDIDAIVQQSVVEAIQETAARYEEEQRARDAEIAELRAQLEALVSQTAEETPPPEESAPEEVPPAPSSQAEISPQPEPGSEPTSEKPAQPRLKASTSYDGFDLKNLYPSYVWENYQPVEEDSRAEWEPEREPEYGKGYEDSERPFGTQLEKDALEAIRLANLERENHGLDPLPIDDDLIKLAEIRSVEIREKYSHTRPDGTSVVDLRCGENCGRKTSPAKQVESWMNSEGHRANILLERYHHIGAACYWAENGNYYWVMVFSLD